MWPKLFTQLVEFLPHATRLMPLADRYLNANAGNADADARAATERTMLELTDRSIQANAAALNTVSEQVQASLGKVARAHIEMAAKLDQFTGMAATLDGFTGQVIEIGTEVKRARRASELAQTRVDALEKQLTSLRTLLLSGLAVVVVLLLVVIVLLVRSHINIAL